ncbi:MAG: hypothetical protein FWF06_02580 [Symbiobacteriaceae bacterium]|nr:hypothetical protein [Symbiobacteriaceae bacterium]
MNGILGGWLAPDTTNKFALISFLYVIAFTSINIFWNFKARGDEPLPKLRRIAGLDAIDEAIGRCTEMGRPVIYNVGMDPLTPPTFASLAILSYVSKQVARYDTRMITVVRMPAVLPIAENSVRQSYLEAGKPDAFRPEDVRFMTTDQFGYATAVLGVTVREKAAAAIMFGYYLAECMVFTEAGFEAGAIQVAGTTNNVQVAFFIASCDYTLIGEELYVASAYLSKDRVRIATLITQDWGKAILVVIWLVGLVLTTCGSRVVQDLLTLY